MRFTDTLERLRGGLIVSCQAYPGEAMRDPRTMAQVAASALAGGAAGIRVQGLDDIRATAHLPVPIVGLWKDGDAEVFITPTLRHAQAVADAGADIVAVDGTRRPRPDGLTLAETIAGLRAYTDALIMADCGSLDDAIAAEAAGADILGTTLSGYTGERPKTTGPDLELIALIAARCRRPIVAEGRVHTPEHAAAAIAAGAFSVCVGTAITHPSTITTWFADAIAGARA
ncbi:N-acetylmannosamine-6-phosphate 2-epimerase [Microbacterium sp.]|uniref:N-acetylmannosamine-6-phosphate 2-epimerase n=1 Tax=Microbacterium sp. TaxID=51671 RepID=UPI00263288BB|nr:N-acetylmannosamine-6-phosphate 2-epimerase [Microbacterium sp.]MCV0334841.1 N-acetylmannosamine-6-phosphate 2-epimerase [Microbacterium sp.]MCV0373980.1 N-acetylmannosamine-6-phosphate 2-epimerase [Microbacterium sp.]MCV0391191.1 N-acetylmannosamine-6-phosphate 2-epimerase [Microbacterium sp.]MCV0418586.1 N-acetylmannosamine-6-phosphate 2-epimerase [Microbacterium sp.]MCV0423031.1 N-acetylmannosamine-6-phosphate 2-epimerase [Microbacterium sp.]